MKKTALIFGITGQDGSYLAELLIKKGLSSSWCKKEDLHHLIHLELIISIKILMKKIKFFFTLRRYN